MARTPGRSTAPKAQPGTGVRFAAGPAAERTKRTRTGLQAPLDACAAYDNTQRPHRGYVRSAGIRYVNVLDYVAGARQHKISQLPAADPTPTVAVDFDGWVFPMGGVAFGWVFDAQVAKGS